MPMGHQLWLCLRNADDGRLTFFIVYFRGNQCGVRGARCVRPVVWPNKPAGLRLVVAADGHIPAYPGKVAHH
jgi:hypothetical protein